MQTSTPGTRTDPSGRTGGGRSAFTLVEFAVVLLVIGLVVWLVAPRIAAVAGRSRDGVFREIAAGSEEAYDVSLFEKREVRLVIEPADGTFRFYIPGGPGEAERSAPREIGKELSITGIRVEGEDRPPDITTEIRYLPGGRVPEVRIFFRERSPGSGRTGEWTLRINSVDGSVDVFEGTVNA